VNCTIKNRPFFSSWSGGKDACLAFYHAVQAGGKPRYLFTMLSEEGECSRSHALPIKILQQHQAQAAPTEYIILSQPTELVHKSTIDNISPKGRLLN
jgi:diphthamide synthase (EF-2-diphthine--ammonia ligase)